MLYSPRLSIAYVYCSGALYPSQKHSSSPCAAAPGTPFAPPRQNEARGGKWDEQALSTRATERGGTLQHHRRLLKKAHGQNATPQGELAMDKACSPCCTLRHHPPPPLHARTHTTTRTHRRAQHTSSLASPLTAFTFARRVACRNLGAKSSSCKMNFFHPFLFFLTDLLLFGPRTPTR